MLQIVIGFETALLGAALIAIGWIFYLQQEFANKPPTTGEGGSAGVLH